MWICMRAYERENAMASTCKNIPSYDIWIKHSEPNNVHLESVQKYSGVHLVHNNKFKPVCLVEYAGHVCWCMCVLLVSAAENVRSREQRKNWKHSREEKWIPRSQKVYNINLLNVDGDVEHLFFTSLTLSIYLSACLLLFRLNVEERTQLASDPVQPVSNGVAAHTCIIWVS